MQIRRIFSARRSGFSLTSGSHFQVDMHAISGQKRVRGRGTYRSTAPPGECVLSWGPAARHTAPKLGICPNRCTDSQRPGASPPSLPPGPPPRAPAFARPGVPPADAVTREGGAAAAPLQVKRDPPAEQKRGQAVSMRHRIAIGPNRQASSRRRITTCIAVAGAWRRRVKSRARMPFSA